MRFKPIIDTSTLKTDEELRRFADNYFDELFENKRCISAGICIFKGRINEKLQERTRASYEFIVSTVNTDEYKQSEEYDIELKYFETASKIYCAEKNENAKTIFDTIEYLDDFFNIWSKMVFYFRRIQLGMSKAVTQEIMKYIRSMKLSVYVPIYILQDCKIGNKEKIAATLAEMYWEQGCFKEALFIVCIAIERSRPQYVFMLEEKRDRILESL